MGFSLSPSVTVREFDLALTVPAVATSIGALVGDFDWGVVDEVTQVDSEKELIAKFGLPNNINYEHWFSAANFLGYSNNLKMVRSVGDAAFNAIGEVETPVADTLLTESSTITASPLLIKNKIDFESTALFTADVPFYARYPSANGNKISVYVTNAAYINNQARTVTFIDDTDTLAFTALTKTIIGGGTADFTGVIVGDKLVVSGTAENDGTYTVAEFTDAQTLIVFETVVDESAVACVLVVNINPEVTWATWNMSTQFDAIPSGEEIFIIVAFDGEIVERFEADQKRSSKSERGGTNYYVEMVNRTSNYIWIPDDSTNGLSYANVDASYYDGDQVLAADGLLPVLFEQTLALGVTDTPDAGDYQTGWDLFLDADALDINLLMQGGTGSLTGVYALQNIAEVRKDCVAFMSPEDTDIVGVNDPTAAMIALRKVGGSLNVASGYGVIDGNYKYQYDKYNDVYRWIPLNADIAGTCARTDDVRDPWWSPAGFNRGQIKNVVKLAFNPSKADRDDLYRYSINPVVAYKGEGTVLYGDKTSQLKPTAFDSRINVRRLFIVLEKAIATAAKYQLFEFNDNVTRNNFINLVEPYLRTVKGRRGIYEYKVVCDTSNNTPEVIDNNEFVADIYIKPAQSINYIYLNFVAVKSGVSFEEVLLTTGELT